MDALASDDTLLFECFRLDRRRGCLLKQDEDNAWRPVAIGSRALAVLAVLADRQGALLAKEEIIAAVWPNTVVEDNNLSVQIAALRRILDRDRTDGSCIQTISGRGYRFIAPVTRIGAEMRSDIRSARTSFDRAERSRPRLSIVVLPFANLSEDREQQYLADGITEDATTDLSRIAGLLVISHTTAVTYRSQRVSARQIGQDLRVRYVLEGSVRRSGNQVRVNAQLIDAETDAHLWAERFDHQITDLFELQSEITGRIAYTLNLELIAAEAKRPVEYPDARDYVFRGRDFFARPPTRENVLNAISCYEQALGLDPESAEAKTYLAGALVNYVNFGFTSSPVVDLARAEMLIDEALAAGTKIPWAHYVKGTVLRRKGRWDDAIAKFEAAMALNPNTTGPLQGLGWCKLYTGSLDEVIPLLEKAIRIGPRDPQIGFRYLIIGEVHELRARPDEAIVWFDKARVTIAAVPLLWAHLAAAHALRGDLAEAAADLAEARRLSPDDRYSTITRLKASQEWGVPKVEALFDATYFTGLRKAGMPEQ